MPTRARHLLTLWNPSYADSAMDAHLEVLLQEASGGEDEAEAGDRYVWWGKLRSPNRQQPLPHTAEILALQAQIDAGEETHLYLTDYRSLYVGHVEEITEEDPRDEFPDQVGRMPAYYTGMRADFWFLVTDLRLLVADDTVATIEELKKLRNTRYHDRPVSLYGGMVELPLVVTRDDEVQWFSGAGELTDGRLWAEQDAERRGETERMGRELRDNLIGRDFWAAMEPSTRNFLASAEAVFRARRDDPRFDFAGPAIEYAKAVETELNALIFPVLRKALKTARPAEREIYLDARRLDLGGRVPHQTLGVLKLLLEKDDTVRGTLKRALGPTDGGWLCDVLPNQLVTLADLRNPAAHSATAKREAVSAARDEVLGIGGEGLVVKLARVRMRT